MVNIVPHTEGCILAVRAQPGARKNGIQGVHNGALKVATTAPPEDGRANVAIMEILRDCLGLSRAQIVLIAGPTNRNKQFLLRGTTVAEIQTRLTELLAS